MATSYQNHFITCQWHIKESEMNKFPLHRIKILFKKTTVKQSLTPIVSFSNQEAPHKSNNIMHKFATLIHRAT